jgi:hypothetical protein
MPDADDLVAQVLADHAVEAVGLTLRDHAWRCRCGDGRETPTGWLESADEARAHQARAVVAALSDHGWHPHYLSTACLHARDEHRDETERAYLHGRCQTDAKRFDGSRKVAATCKWGQEPCRCECHQPTVAPADLAGDCPSDGVCATPPPVSDFDADDWQSEADYWTRKAGDGFAAPEEIERRLRMAERARRARVAALAQHSEGEDDA